MFSNETHLCKRFLPSRQTVDVCIQQISINIPKGEAQLSTSVIDVDRNLSAKISAERLTDHLKSPLNDAGDGLPDELEVGGACSIHAKHH